MRTVHFVGFRGDEFNRARRVWGGPAMVHMVNDQRVWTEVGEDDVVVFANKETEENVREFVWDASAVPSEFTD